MIIYVQMIKMTKVQNSAVSFIKNECMRAPYCSFRYAAMKKYCTYTLTVHFIHISELCKERKGEGEIKTKTMREREKERVRGT